MKRLITTDDFIELYSKLQQRGSAYLLSKLNPSSTKRTQSTFGESSFQHANWWIIPKVRRRWNKLVTGDPDQIYEDYVVDKYLTGKSNLKMLSLGCGIGSHERILAKHNTVFAQIEAYDIAPNLIDRANQLAHEEGLDNIQFHCKDVNKMAFEKDSFDVVFFHSSLHHFLKLDKLMGSFIPNTLCKDGFLILNDFWGPDRLQWSKTQVQEINRLLKQIPEQYRTRFRSKVIKRKVSGPGWFRMRLSDPSEAAESSKIPRLLEKHYHCLEEKMIGGNILMPLLKDIAHHFAADTPETNTILDELFLAEDELIKQERSLLFFGVYQVK